MRIPFQYKNSKDIYVLTNDKNGYQIGKMVISVDKETKEKRELLTDNSYFSSLPSAIESILERGIKKSEAITFIQLARDIENIRSLIDSIAKEFFIIKMEIDKK